MRITIDGRAVDVREELTILQACEENGVSIPTLCYLKEINCIAACRVCLVEVNGKLLPACATKVREDMAVVTENETIRTARRRNLELICSDHHMDCTDCRRGADCELRALCKKYEVDDRAYGIGKRNSLRDESSSCLVRDNAKCVLCRRCEATCAKVQGVKAITANNKGDATTIGFGLPLAQTDCVGCGQCVAACPTGALLPKDDSKKAWKAIFDKESYVVATVSPSAYLRICELFGEAPDTDCGRKLAEILRKIGFDAVFDMAESEKLRENTMLVKASQAKAPVLSGDCPAWRRYVKRFHPELADHLLEAYDWRKALEAQCNGKAGDKKLFVVQISNCIAEKEGSQADAALSTRETFEIIRRACVSNFTADKVWHNLKGENFDALPLNSNVSVPELRVLAVSGLAEAEKALAVGGDYDLVQVQACPGGCINGGGLPHRKNVET